MTAAARAPLEGERFLTLFAHTSDVMLVLSDSGALRVVNPAAERLLGYRNADLAGQALLEFIAPEFQDAVAAIPQRIQPGVELETEVELVARSGDRVALAARVVRATAPGGDTEYLWIARDRTRRKLAEERVREALHISNDFVTAVTHQLRAPLTVIKWSLDLATESPHLPHETRELIAGSRDAADELIRVSSDLLKYAGIDAEAAPLAQQPVDLGALTWKVLRDLRWFANAQGHQITVGTAGQSSTVMSDPIPLGQIMQSLLGNVIRYTPAATRISIGILGERDSVIWSVTDSGQGVPAELRDRLFDRFGGTTNDGVGLYIVRRLVERLGGTAWVESEAGEGTTFAIRIPRRPAPLQQPAEAA